MDAEQVYAIWSGGGRSHDERCCPSCTRVMQLSTLRAEEADLAIDVCDRCHLLWFDDGELKTLQELAPRPEVAVPHEADPGELQDPRSRQALALMQIELRARADREARPDRGLSPLERSVSLLGIPTLVGNEWRPARHWLTFGLIAALTLLHLLGLAARGEPLLGLGLVPDHPLRLLGLTWVTAFFVHGGWLHLLGNAYFLAEFGGEAEDELGRRDLALLLFASTIIGNVMHSLTTSEPALPLVGASGGISGLVAFYALTFPERPIAVFLRFTWIRLPVAAFLALWVVLQFIGLALQAGNVAYGAHLGGALVGLIAALQARRQRRRRRAEDGRRQRP